jgi:hypothetical protein
MIKTMSNLYQGRLSIEHSKVFAPELADFLKERSDQIIRQNIDPLMAELRGMLPKLLEAETPIQAMERPGGEPKPEKSAVAGNF